MKLGRFVPTSLRRQVRRWRQLDRLTSLDSRLDDLAQAIGRVEARQTEDRRTRLQDHEFKVYSHAGEDGIIQFLVHALDVTPKRFVEFGVEDYLESNTRFLLAKDQWSGLVLDGSADAVARIRRQPVFWNSDLTAVPAFVTRENIDDLLTEHGFAGDLGLLSVDVDGNDYWIFDAISAVRPVVAVVEYNHRFGPHRSVTIPYDPSYVRRRTDSSWLFGGASLAAIVAAAKRKSLAFVGCNSFGNNAFFVHQSVLPSWLPELTPEQGFMRGRFRESMLINGREVVLTADEEKTLLATADLAEVK